MSKDKGTRTALIALAMAEICLTTGCRRGIQSAEFEVARVKRATLIENVTATGQLSAVVSVDVGSQISGTIAKLYVDFNSPVKKGDVIADIDPATYRAAMRQAEGEVASAKAALELSRVTEKRQRELLPLHSSTQADLDKAVADLHEAEASVQIKEGALELARVNLQRCRILAPVDGVVINRKVDAGQTVAAQLTAPVLFTIAQDITEMYINASVSEADIGKVAPGQSVDFSVDAFPDETFRGRVAQVRKYPTTTENVVTYDTVIRVENPEQKLFPGMTANVSILVAERQNVLSIPNTALRFVPPTGTKIDNRDVGLAISTGQRLVYLAAANGSGLKPAVVKIGITNGVDSEIIDGVREGDKVATAAKTPATKSSGGPPGGGPV